MEKDKFDERMGRRLIDAEIMFKRMMTVVDKVEGPAKLSLGSQFLIFISVLAYTFL